MQSRVLLLLAASGLALASDVGGHASSGYVSVYGHSDNPHPPQAEIDERQRIEAQEDEIETHREEHLALEVSLLIILVCMSLLVGQALHAAHVYWLPESGATILIGFLFGVLLHILDAGKGKGERTMYFDPEFFNLFLLPPIIFESGFTLNQFLFFRNLGSVSTFAVIGTLITTCFTWAALYHAGLWGYIAPMTMAESGAFASLISAVDPVATLGTFGALGVDPSLNNLVFGESVLNDAVALILFRSITHYGIFAEFSPAVHLPTIVLSFVVTSLGSIIYGVGVGLAGALILKAAGMGRHGQAPGVEMAIFWAVSYFSFVGAEVPHLSGIVASLFCGITMKRYAAPNLSSPARRLTDKLFKSLSVVADTIVFILVGLAMVLYVDEIDVAFTAWTVVFVLVGTQEDARRDLPAARFPHVDFHAASVLPRPRAQYLPPRRHFELHAVRAHHPK